MDDWQAIEKLRSGDIDGLAHLVHAYQISAVGAAFLITQDRALAEDIVQEAFLRVYERISQFDQGHSFRPWFFQIVVNDALKAVRQRKRQLSLDWYKDTADLTLITQLAHIYPGPEELHQQVELRQTVLSALKQLTPAQRVAVVQRYYLGMSEAEMAEALTCPSGTIKWRLHTARTRLRTLLASLHIRRSNQTHEEIP